MQIEMIRSTITNGGGGSVEHQVYEVVHDELGRFIEHQWMVTVPHPLPGAPNASMRTGYDTEAAAVAAWEDGVTAAHRRAGLACCGDVLRRVPDRFPPARRLCGGCSSLVDVVDDDERILGSRFAQPHGCGEVLDRWIEQGEEL